MSLIKINPEKAIVYEEQTWRVKFPNQTIESAIEAETARRFNFAPIESIDSEIRFYMKAKITLNFVVIAKPENHEDIKDFASLYDEEWVIGLYNEYYKYFLEFKKELEEKKRPTLRETFDEGSSRPVSNSQVQNPSSGSEGTVSGADRIPNEDGTNVGGLRDSIPPTRTVGATRKAASVQRS